MKKDKKGVLKPVFILIWVFSVLMTVGISSFITYSLFTKPSDEINVLSPFEVKVAKIKKQAEDATIFFDSSDYSERNEAAAKIGLELQELLKMGSGTLTNSTFNDPTFSVQIKDSTELSNGTVKQIQYTLSQNENDLLYEESRYFLQYVGETNKTSIFCEIQHVWDDFRFDCFEAGQEIFVFLTYANDAYYNLVIDSSDYKYFNTNLYHFDGSNFTLHANLNIPLTLTSSAYEMIMTQKGSDIHASIVHGSEEKAVSTFNKTSFTFEREKTNISQRTTLPISNGLLLGLSDNRGNLRTLWIRKREDKLLCNEIPDKIVFSREGFPYSVGIYEEYKKLTEEEIRAGTLDYSKLLAAPIGEDSTEILRDMLNPVPEYGFYDLTEVPLYIGEEYICYIQSMGYSGGGTYHWGESNIYFCPIDALSDFDTDYENELPLKPNFKQEYLSDFVFGKDAKHLYQEDFQNLFGDPFLDFSNLVIKRNYGRWSLAVPLFEEYYHPGNGSNGVYIKDFATFSNDVPKSLVSKEKEIETFYYNDNWKYSVAKDVLLYPNEDVVLLMSDYKIDIFEPRKSVDNGFTFEVPIQPEEFIVSICWISEENVPEWETNLSEHIMTGT